MCGIDPKQSLGFANTPFEIMIRIFGIIVATCCSIASAQQAELEVHGVFGECNPVHAAAQDGLTLYRKPDLRSKRIEIPYREGWRIPAPKRDGLTRVLQIGALRVTGPNDRMYCTVPPTSGQAKLRLGEIVEYLYDVGEGFGEIRVRGGQCQAYVAEMLDHFEVIRLPDVQVWLNVYFADGSSPGWQFYDGSQTRVAGVRC